MWPPLYFLWLCNINFFSFFLIGYLRLQQIWNKRCLRFQNSTSSLILQSSIVFPFTVIRVSRFKKFHTFSSSPDIISCLLILLQEKQGKGRGQVQGGVQFRPLIPPTFLFVEISSSRCSLRVFFVNKKINSVSSPPLIKTSIVLPSSQLPFLSPRSRVPSWHPLSTRT